MGTITGADPLHRPRQGRLWVGASFATLHVMDTPTTVHKLADVHSNGGILTRTIDAIDRAHARTATHLHDRRSSLVSKLEAAIDRAEEIMTSMFERARKSIQKVDVVSADAVNRTQGLVGQALERARLARSKPGHLAS